MNQFVVILSAALVGIRERRTDTARVTWGSATLLDRLLDLLTIFRRPVPVPVKTRRR